MMSFGVTMATYSAQTLGQRNTIVFGLVCVNVSNYRWHLQVGIILNLFSPNSYSSLCRRGTWGCCRVRTTILPYKRTTYSFLYYYLFTVIPYKALEEHLHKPWRRHGTHYAFCCSSGSLKYVQLRQAALQAMAWFGSMVPLMIAYL